MRLIDADALKLSMLLIAPGETKKYCYPCREILKAIDDAPTIEERKGKWIRETKHYKDSEQEFYYYEERCSECGTKRKIGWAEVRYCPNCGAKMKGEKP